VIILKGVLSLRNFLLSWLIGFYSLQVIAQMPFPQITQFEEDSINISLDGFVDEAAWESIPVIDGMKIIDPDTLQEPPYKTDIRFFSTEQGLYFGIVNHQPPDSLIARITNRDASPLTPLNDGIGVVIDASGDGRYGYGVRIGLGDSMTDMSMLPERQINLQWDGAWDGRTQIIDEGWSAEIFVPWSMMPLPQVGSTRRIGLVFMRNVMELGELYVYEEVS